MKIQKTHADVSGTTFATILLPNTKTSHELQATVTSVLTEQSHST